MDLSPKLQCVKLVFRSNQMIQRLGPVVCG
jgi:hypothetical protein